MAGDGSSEGNHDMLGSAVRLVRSSEASLTLQFKSRLQSSPAPSVAQANTEKIPLGLLDCPTEQKRWSLVPCEEQSPSAENYAGGGALLAPLMAPLLPWWNWQKSQMPTLIRAQFSGQRAPPIQMESEISPRDETQRNVIIQHD